MLGILTYIYINNKFSTFYLMNIAIVLVYNLQTHNVLNLNII